MKSGAKLAVSLTVLLLVSALAVSLGFAVNDRKNYSAALDNIYKKNYYEATDTLYDTELKLSKLALSEGDATRKNLLYDVWLNSEAAADRFSTLAAKNSNTDKIIRFFNQLGDYCYYLAKNLDNGVFDDAARAKLKELKTIVASLKTSMQSGTDEVMNGASLVGRLEEGISLIGDCYEHFNNDSSIEYPEMIYDGPFSDGLADRDAKFLKGKEQVSQDAAEAKLKEYFSGVSDISLLSEVGGSIPSYLFYFNWNGKEGSAEITKAGGYLLSFASMHEVTNPVLTDDECKLIAENAVKSLGYDDMETVWVSNSHSSVYVNLAFKKDGAVYYPDLIKVKVASDTGNIIGYECANYIYNHTAERTTAPVENGPDAAKTKVSKKLVVETVRLCVIPTEWNTEIAAYEFYGSYDGGKYFIYIDAETLEEIEVKMVIENDGAAVTG